MIIVVRHHPLTNSAAIIVEGLQSEDIVIAAEDAVYGADNINHNNPNVTVYAVDSDCRARGVTVTGAQLIDDQQLATLSAQHNQWVTLP